MVSVKYYIPASASQWHSPQHVLVYAIIIFFLRSSFQHHATTGYKEDERWLVNLSISTQWLTMMRLMKRGWQGQYCVTDLSKMCWSSHVPPTSTWLYSPWKRYSWWLFSLHQRAQKPALDVKSEVQFRGFFFNFTRFFCSDNLSQVRPGLIITCSYIRILRSNSEEHHLTKLICTCKITSELSACA
jgi:hypothetical protein